MTNTFRITFLLAVDSFPSQIVTPVYILNEYNLAFALRLTDNFVHGHNFLSFADSSLTSSHNLINKLG